MAKSTQSAHEINKIIDDYISRNIQRYDVGPDTALSDFRVQRSAVRQIVSGNYFRHVVAFHGKDKTHVNEIASEYKRRIDGFKSHGKDYLLVHDVVSPSKNIASMVNILCKEFNAEHSDLDASSKELFRAKLKAELKGAILTRVKGSKSAYIDKSRGIDLNPMENFVTSMEKAVQTCQLKNTHKAIMKDIHNDRFGPLGATVREVNGIARAAADVAGEGAKKIYKNIPSETARRSIAPLTGAVVSLSRGLGLKSK